jgi:hypothetical protein
MVGFIDTSLQLQSILTAHNQWLSKTRSIPYWTTSVFSSAVTNDERRITAHTLNCLERLLSDEWRISRDWNLLDWTNFQADRIWITISNASLILLLFILSVATKRSSLLPSNGGPTVDCVTSRMCLPKRCLASGHIPPQYVTAYFKLRALNIWNNSERNQKCTKLAINISTNQMQ